MGPPWRGCLPATANGSTPSSPSAARATASSRSSAIESADPRWVAAAIDGLQASAHRLRAMGTIACTLCQVAAARFDGMLTLSRCRGVDAAAAQLIVREAGGLVAFTAYADPPGRAAGHHAAFAADRGPQPRGAG